MREYYERKERELCTHTGCPEKCAEDSVMCRAHRDKANEQKRANRAAKKLAVVALFLAGCGGEVSDPRHAEVTFADVALEEWGAVSLLDWSEATAGDVAMKPVRECSGSVTCIRIAHDSKALDGTGWAGATYPDDEGFRVLVGDVATQDLELVIDHELGHCLGLQHVEPNGSDLMQPGFVPNGEIGKASLAEYRKIYPDAPSF